MTRTTCEREDHTTAAVLSGPVSAEVVAHARECAACSEILLVTEFLRENQTLAAHKRPTLPDASAIWHKAQQRATQEAVRRALRPIRFMKIIAIFAFLASPWLRFLVPIGRDSFSSLSRSFDFNLSLAPRMWPSTTSQLAILLGFAAATILLSLSSWYMVRQE